MICLHFPPSCKIYDHAHDVTSQQIVNKSAGSPCEIATDSQNHAHNVTSQQTVNKCTGTSSQEAWDTAHTCGSSPAFLICDLIWNGAKKNPGSVSAMGIQRGEKTPNQDHWMEWSSRREMRRGKMIASIKRRAMTHRKHIFWPVSHIRTLRSRWSIFKFAKPSCCSTVENKQSGFILHTEWLNKEGFKNAMLRVTHLPLRKVRIHTSHLTTRKAWLYGCHALCRWSTKMKDGINVRWINC